MELINFFRLSFVYLSSLSITNRIGHSSSISLFRSIISWTIRLIILPVLFLLSLILFPIIFITEVTIRMFDPRLALLNYGFLNGFVLILCISNSISFSQGVKITTQETYIIPIPVYSSVVGPDCSCECRFIMTPLTYFTLCFVYLTVGFRCVSHIWYLLTSRRYTPSLISIQYNLPIAFVNQIKPHNPALAVFHELRSKEFSLHRHESYKLQMRWFGLKEPEEHTRLLDISLDVPPPIVELDEEARVSNVTLNKSV